MSAWYGTFALVMALLVMALAVFALPPALRPVLIAAGVIGLVVGLLKIRRKAS